MRPNPAWADRVIERVWRKLQRAVPAAWLPETQQGMPSFTLRDYGEGCWGAAMPTHDPLITMKITNDKSEAYTAARMLNAFGDKWPPGIARHHAVFFVQSARESRVMPHFGTSPPPGPDNPVLDTYLLWRDSIVPGGELLWLAAQKMTKDAAQLNIAALNFQHYAIRLRPSLMAGQKKPKELRQLHEDGYLKEYEKRIAVIGRSKMGKPLAAGLKAMFDMGLITTDAHNENVAKVARTGEYSLFDLGYTFPSIVMPKPAIPSIKKLAAVIS